ncbi:1,4-alpha-glucan branching enzyme [Litchfieldia alkalitelluris]|uniref:1,4-alpha-glucan branching enzyme n=1 Tax=Litchfieldia alkalitelluris TaxID=304268 RepID=UPI0009986D92|nr:1,4-alpha-glucan branching enzyme [Litchfieldia alkalitelluris]
MKVVVALTSPTEYEIHLFHEGNLFKGYNLFGAHIQVMNNVKGTRFCVWAPHASEVRVVGDFNEWNGINHSLSRINSEGIWAGFFSDVIEGAIYKYEILTSNGKVLLKSDPYAFYSELRPNTASVVYNLDNYSWNDDKWLKQKKKKNNHTQPFFIYECHLGSWKNKDDGSLLSYIEMADELIPYVKEHGFTHIELLPLIEHPLDLSWGYQGTGYYSATSRFGSPHDLMFLIDQCHQNDIGVLLDWVPGHFCKDSHGLYMFDGEPTYEYKQETDRENYVWGTANFDLGRTEVQSFLISNALFWMEYYHIDGFRVDAVANMLYWPNQQDQLHKNELAVKFLQKLNQTVLTHDSTILMIAEDSTDWPKVTVPVEHGGLGFTYKWNMGWMNDILEYMEATPENRVRLHHKVTFSLLYAFSEKFILPFSHDEVVHGKKSLLDKMPGDYWSKFAQLRLLYGFLLTHPGKKLLFMGGEFGQFSEWKELEQLDWLLEEYEMHQNIRKFFKELMKLYKKHKPLYEEDHHSNGFEWIDADNHEQRIFSFIRKGSKEDDFLVIVCNFSQESYETYNIGVPVLTDYKEVLNSDDIQYGGSGKVNKKQLESIDTPFHGRPFHIKMTIPPFGITVLRPVKKRGERMINGSKKMRSDVTSGGTGE